MSPIQYFEDFSSHEKSVLRSSNALGGNMCSLGVRMDTNKVAGEKMDLKDSKKVAASQLLHQTNKLKEPHSIERKVMGAMQRRIGPNKVGYLG